MTPLNDEEILRYNRQLVLKGFDFDRQEQLKSSRVLIVGLGGLGCAAAPWLVSSGVGELTLVDFDKVSLSNLQRQILHSDDTLGMAKTDSAVLSLRKINPWVTLNTLSEPLSEDNADSLVRSHDAVVDCSDNVTARECLNAACFRHKVPLISGAAIRMEGQLSVFRWQENEPCYRCMSRLFGEQNLSCVEAGVMAPLVGVIGAMQAMETIKVLTEYGETASGKIMLYEAMTSQFREIRLMRDPECEVCGQAAH
ncbi:molybdopterin-synthase adenylyltransferase MoeB [Tatumella citrea]|uniref:Molybdopterin-synthase adenylyltransferase n=1 Tax=Tatumella citrea TaxID=53336 RepID=A0A1Y0L691_TATCI|nr:molybdopterin-synthase adenylyltransferase MoeB [Tatumella citrea]ARU93477.1 molybdopterin-synthase adenylyltransferase MoeB [Tatumella citrea]ARU97516.1 molybdopterin-synthase adenylyltransferase MoeB [Tatumella citrea]